MMLPDVNVLVYAFRGDMADHSRLRNWLARMVSGARPYGMSEMASSAFVGIVTNRRVFEKPGAPPEARSFTSRLPASPFGPYLRNVRTRGCSAIGVPIPCSRLPRRGLHA